MNTPAALLVAALVTVGSSAAIGQASSPATPMPNVGPEVTPSTTDTAKHRHHHRRHLAGVNYPDLPTTTILAGLRRGLF